MSCHYVSMTAHCPRRVRMHCYRLNVPLRQRQDVAITPLILTTLSQPWASVTDIRSGGVAAHRPQTSCRKSFKCLLLTGLRWTDNTLLDPSWITGQEYQVVFAVILHLPESSSYNSSDLCYYVASRKACVIWWGHKQTIDIIWHRVKDSKCNHPKCFQKAAQWGWSLTS